MGTRGTGDRAVSKSGNETSGIHLSRDDYIERLKALGLTVKGQQSGLGNDWIHVRHPQSGYTAQVRYFEEPSEYGIDGGRISKLWIAGPDGKARVEYDRGWSKRPPKSGTAKVLYESLVALAREPGEGKKK